MVVAYFRHFLNSVRAAVRQPYTRVAFKKATFVVLVAVVGFLSLAGVFSYTRGGASAAANNNLNFQARLLDSSGNLVADGSYNIEFNLYTQQAPGGTSEWTEDYLNSASQGVTVKNGFLSVNLGSITSFPSTIAWDQQQWLGMTVRGTGSCAFGACTPADAEMTPRFKLTAVPYAFRAAKLMDSTNTNAFTADDLLQKAPGTPQVVSAAVAALRLNQTSTGGLLQLQKSGTDVYSIDNGGNVTSAATGTSTYSLSNTGQVSLVSDLTTAGRATSVLSITQANNATNNTTVPLLTITNSDTASTGTLATLTQSSTAAANALAITSASTTAALTVATPAGGTAFAATGVTSGTAFNANTVTSGTAFSATGAITGTGLSLTGVTTGNGVNVGGANTTTGTGLLYNTTSNTFTTGKALNVTGAAAGITTDFSGAYISVTPTRTLAAAATRNDSGNFINLTRSNTVTNTGGTYNITGALANLQSNCTVTAGTCADSSNILNLNEQYANASGAVLNITGAGTGNLATLDASNTNANGVSVDIQSSSNAKYAFKVTSNNAATNGLIVLGNGNVGIGNAAPSALLGIGSSNQFQVDNTGAIAAATGITSSGTIQLSGLSTNGFVKTSGGSGTLTVSSSIGLTSDVSGVLPIANGGTNSSATPTAGAVAYGTGTAYGFTAAGTAGQCLTSNGSGVPTWASCAGTGSGATLQASYDNGNTITTTNGRDFSLTLADTTTDANALINIASGSTGRFAVQNNGTDVLGVSTSGVSLSGATNVTGSNTFTVGTGATALGGTLSVSGQTTLSDNLLANGAATAITGTAVGTPGVNTTTIGLTAAGSFANNDVIYINNAGQSYYTRIVSGAGTTTLTVSPAVSYDAGATITKYTVQNIGATSSNYTTQTNRFFQGYFLGGVIVGAGSTTLSDGNLSRTTGDITIKPGTGGALQVPGTLNATTINATTITGDGSALTNLNGANISGGSIADSSLSSNVVLLSGTQTLTGGKTFSADATFSGAGTGLSVTNDASVGGALTVTGAVNANGALIAAGPTNLNGDTTIGNASTDRLTITSQLLGANALVFQGATDNSFTTTLQITDPTANNTITVPNASGTIAVSASGNIALSAAGNITLTGQVPIANGGTNATSQQGAINNLAGLTTAGDLLYFDGVNASRLARGSNGQCLTSTAGSIAWGSCTTGAVTTFGTIDTGVYSANGGSISGSTIYLQTADATHTGLINSTTQNIGGVKTFVDGLTLTTGKTLTVNGDALTDLTGTNLTNNAGALSVVNNPTFSGLITGQAGLTVTNGGNVAFQKATDITATGTLNNQVISGASVRFAGGSAQTLTGINGGADGRVLTLINAAATPLVINNNDTVNSSSTSVIITGTNAPISVPAGGSITVIYDAGTNVWRVEGGVSATGGVGVNTVGAVGSPSSNGATISGTTLFLDAADGSNPGLVTSTSQILGGTKTFAGGLTITTGQNFTVNGDVFTDLTGANLTVSGGALTTVANPSFATSVTSPSFTGTGAVTLSSGGSSDLTLDSASNVLVLSDPTLRRTAAGSTSLQLNDTANTTFSIVNTDPTAVANLSVEGSVTAASFVGNGAGLTNIADANLSANVALLTGTQSFSGLKTFGAGLTVTAGQNLTVNGDVLTDLTGTNLTNSSGALSLVANPSFATSVTSPSFTGTAGVTLSSGGSSALTLDSASNTLVIAANDTTLQRTAAGTYTIDLNDAATTVLSLINSNATGTADLNLADGGLTTAGTSRLTNGGVLQNITGLTIASGGASVTGTATFVNDIAANGNTTLGNATTDRLTITSQILGGSPLVFQGATDNSFATTFAVTDPTANQTITVPNESGTLLLLGPAAAQVDAGTNSAVNINKTGASGNILTLSKGGTGVFSVGNGGATTIATTSSTALTVGNASSTLDFFTVDTSGNIVKIGDTTADATGVVLVLDTKNTAGDPAGGAATAGAQYFNSAWQQYRCYREVAWETCGVTPVDRAYAITDEFMSGYVTCGAGTALVGGENWACNSSGTATLTYNAGTILPSADHPGIMHIATAAANGNGATMSLNGATSTNGSIIISDSNRVLSTVGVGATITNARLRVGLHSEAANNTRPVSGVWWEADASTNANWNYCYGNGTTATCASSGVAIAANTLVSLDIQMTATGAGTSAATFRINGTAFSVSGVTIDTTNKVSPAISCFNSTAAVRDCYVDYFQFSGVASARR